MFPFNAKRAIEGAAIVTGEGRPARFIGTLNNQNYPLAVAVADKDGQETVAEFTDQGHFLHATTGDPRDLFMVVADHPPGVYALQRGTYATLAEAFDNGAVYRVDTLDGPTLQLEQSRAAIRGQMVVAQATLNAVGVGDEWVVRFFNGKREYTYNDVTRLGDPREEK